MARMTEDDTPARPSEESYGELLEIRERRTKDAPRPAYTCQTCEDYAVVWWPWMKSGKPDWYVLRCHCGQRKLWGPKLYWLDGQDESGKEKRTKDIRHEWQPYPERIPLWDEFRDASGGRLSKMDIYSASAVAVFETLLMEHASADAREERKAIQGETDYSFDGNVR